MDIEQLIPDRRISRGLVGFDNGRFIVVARREDEATKNGQAVWLLECKKCKAQRIAQTSNIQASQVACVNCDSLDRQEKLMACCEALMKAIANEEWKYARNQASRVASLCQTLHRQNSE